MSDGEQLTVERINDLGSIRSEWSALAEASGNVFATWEFSDIWWRAFGADRPLLVTACRRDDGSLATIVPLYEASRRPVRVLRFLGHGSAALTGPISAAGDPNIAAAGLRATLRARLWPWDVLFADGLPAREVWRARVGGRRWGHPEADPVLRIDGAGWEQYLATLSSNLRQQVRRRERKLLAAHDVQIRLVHDPARLAEDFETFLRLHDARWEGSSTSFAGERGDFHREFAAVAFERGWLRLWIMEVDDAPVAAWYGFRFGGADWFRQAGRDPAWDRHNVGFVLLVRTIREAFEDEMREYRFLRGDDAYKFRFANDDPGAETIVLGRGLSGRGAILGVASARALPIGPLRRALRRVTGIERY